MQNQKLVVLVGNMHTDVKGHPWLIEAAPAVLKEFPHTRFVFAGDGEARPAFEQQAAKLGVQTNFMFLGRRNDIPDVLASCDIAVLPSRAEGLPNAVLEYMAAGLPTIASRVGGNCGTGGGWCDRVACATRGFSRDRGRVVAAVARS